jgi:hypothetical protein
MHPAQEVGRVQADLSRQSDDETLLDSAQVKQSLGGKSDMCLWRWTRNPKVMFPPPDLIINNRRYWFKSTIRRFKAGLASATAGTQTRHTPERAR